MLVFWSVSARLNMCLFLIFDLRISIGKIEFFLFRFPASTDPITVV